MARHSQFSNSLKQLHDANRRLSELSQRAEHVNIVSGRSLVEDYNHCDLSLILDFAPLQNFDPVRAGTGQCPIERAHVAPWILYLQAVQEGNVKEWNQQSMFISPVEYVNGPHGTIPSVVGLYLGDYEIVEAGSGLVYFSIPKRIFQKLTSRVNGEFVRLLGSDHGVFHQRTDPRVIKSAFEIMNRVPDHQSKVAGVLAPLANAILQKLISSLRIDLDAGSVLVRQDGDSSFNLRDVLVGPFNFQSGRPELLINRR